uniref:Peroxisomal membrane protein 2 n=1 Tax=Erpetoichthys calabaricus TaxID=27687 RepID=A0A8C4S4N2_ERPCA
LITILSSCKHLICSRSGILSALGNLLSQGLEKRDGTHDSEKPLKWLGPTRFAIYGLFFTGPISHYFYQCLELLVPSTASHNILKRLLLDRLIFAPAILLLFFLVMNFLEGKKNETRVSQMKSM